MLKIVLSGEKFEPRCELIAPLDPFLWDKSLIRSVFSFDYSWEIYNPAVKRKYGTYILPLLYGNAFIGRVEAVNDRRTNTLIIRNIWYENGADITKEISSAVDECLTPLCRLQWLW